MKKYINSLACLLIFASCSSWGQTGTKLKTKKLIKKGTGKIKKGKCIRLKRTCNKKVSPCLTALLKCLCLLVVDCYESQIKLYEGIPKEHRYLFFAHH
ncbi:hypothetical protein ACFLYU_00140 [Candidatus Dependentiae bacterium]